MTGDLSLIKNKDEFDKWKENNIFSGDSADKPVRFPCFARTRVISWNNETEEALYLYREDIQQMLIDITL